MKIIINGQGAMGQNLAHIISDTFGVQLLGFTNYTANDPQRIEEIKDFSEAHILIDFSHPAQLPALLELAEKYHLPLLLATTGFTAEDFHEMKQTAKKVPLLQTYNTSQGILALQYLLKQAATILDDYDIEILEKHHHKKIDAPSGTALQLKDTLVEARTKTKTPIQSIITNRNAQAKKQPDEIGIQSLRMGEIFGEHSVYFAAHDEVIEIKHTALSKKLFAQGAIKLAEKFLSLNPSTGFFQPLDLFKNHE